jgi:Ca-activated chloride channel family protein
MLPDWFQHIHFSHPEMFSLFAWLPVMIWWYSNKTGKNSAVLKVSTVQSFIGSSAKTNLRHLPFILRLLALSSLIIALAQPQKRNDEKFTQGDGIDIVLCMDVSGSMLSRDFQPTRLAVAKEMAAEFIRNRPVDRIGLVIFAGESFTLCPLTTDKNTLLTQVNALQSGLLEDGTLIGEGLATAVSRLTAISSKSKVIILLTDGKEETTENRVIDPLMALEIAKAGKVKVYSIGMAAEGFVPVEEKTKSGVKRKNVKFLDEDLLKKIAAETGGKYFRARDKNGLKSIYDEIDTLEKVKIEQTSFKRTEEKFLPFVLAALCLLFFEILLRYTVFRKFP